MRFPLCLLIAFLCFVAAEKSKGNKKESKEDKQEALYYQIYELVDVMVVNWADSENDDSIQRCPRGEDRSEMRKTQLTRKGRPQRAELCEAVALSVQGDCAERR